MANAVAFRDLLPSPQTNCVTQLLFVWRQAPLTNYDLAAGASHVLDTELHMSCWCLEEGHLNFEPFQAYFVCN